MDLKESMKTVTAIHGFLTVVSLLIQVIEHEIWFQMHKYPNQKFAPWDSESEEPEFYYEFDREPDFYREWSNSNKLRVANCLICLIMAALSVKVNLLQALKDRLRGKLPANHGVMNSLEMPWIVFECLFMLLHIPPYLELIKATKYFNLIYTVLISMMAFKTSVLFRSLELFSPLNNQTSRLIMFFSKVEFTDRSILVKAWINMNPGKFLFFSFVFYMIVASYILKISERTNIYNKPISFDPVDRCYENNDQDYNNPSVSNEPVTYFNAFWMLSITFLTVGYGDYYPMTFPGRIIAVITTVLGQLYAAIVVGIVSQ